MAALPLIPPIEPSDPVVAAYHASFPYSYGGRRLVEQGFRDGVNLPASGVREQLLKSEAFTRFRPYRRRKDAVPVYVYKKREQIQADICYLPKNAQVLADNDNKKFALVFIDVFTKWAWIYALARTTGEEVTHIFRTRFLHECVPPPETILTDQGPEFKNRLFTQACIENNIVLRFASPQHKCPVVERFNRTFQRLLYQQMEAMGTQQWINLLPQTLTIYHHRRHRTIKTSPFEAEEAINQRQVLAAHLERYAKTKPPPKPKYKVGQTVRLVLNRMSVMRRGYHPTYTWQVYKIFKVLDNLPLPRYEVVTLRGEPVGSPISTWFENELSAYNPSQPAPFKMERILDQQQRDSGEFYLIKWKGYNENYNSWIHQDQYQQLRDYLSPEEQSILVGNRVGFADFPPIRGRH